ncbi:MAG: hypothetical protein IKO42_00425 [Opitutales bacterium]|nr:hypothetical protein [Opitutales bacterium]
MGKIRAILFSAFAAFANFAFAGVAFYSDLDALLKKAELEDRAIAFIISPNCDKAVKDMPEFKDKKFLDFASENYLFCNADVSLSGKAYKFKNKKIGGFVSKFLDENERLSSGGYIILLFKHPNRFYVSTRASALAGKQASSGGKKKKSDSKAAGSFSDSYLLMLMKSFFAGQMGSALADKSTQATTAIKPPNWVAPPSVSTLQQMAKKEGKYIVFVVSQDVKNVFNAKIFADPDFVNYASENMIFVPVRRIYKGTRVKAKIADSEYAAFLESLDIVAAFSPSDVFIFYHPERKPFSATVSDTSAYIRRVCEDRKTPEK